MTQRTDIFDWVTDAAPVGDEDSREFDEMLDEAEAAAGMRRMLPAPTGALSVLSTPSVAWRSIAFSGEMALGTTLTMMRRLHLPFLARWFLVSTPGFQVMQVRFGYELILDDVDGDLFLCANWDKLERESQLDRVRLSSGRWLQEHTSIQVSVKPRSAPAFRKGSSIPFRAMLLGEQLQSRH